MPKFFQLKSRVILGLLCFSLNTSYATDDGLWEKLLHYESHHFSQPSSDADGIDFFISPNGMKSSADEMQADLEAFTTNSKNLVIGNLKQKPRCAFPARYNYLRDKFPEKFSKLENDQVDPSYEKDCSELIKWKQQLNPQSVTLVFATAYLGNAGSMFGHTFLRIDSKPTRTTSEKNDLLDYGINFAALTGSDGGIGFAIKGLTGFYRGDLGVQPYHSKVKEYTDSESRDLWEYELNLNQKQIDRLLNHIWELGTTYFDYYFLSKNCSYYLLTLLEIANPELSLTEKTPPWMIPADSVRIVTKNKNLVRKVKFRPSLYRQLKAKYQLLSDSQKSLFSTYKSPEQLDSQTLDLVIDYDKFLHPNNLDANYELLKIRAKTGTIDSNKIETYSMLNQPDLGHDSAKISIGFGRLFNPNTSKFFAEINLRPAFHDLLDADDGYAPFSEISVLKSSFRYYLGHKPALESLEVISVTSLTPVDTFQSTVSWKFNTGFIRPDNYYCLHCPAYSFRGTGGYSRYLDQKNENHLLYFMPGAGLELASRFAHFVRIAPLLDVGYLANVFSKTKFSLNLTTSYFFFDSNAPSFVSKFFAGISTIPFFVDKNFEMRFLYNRVQLAKNSSNEILGNLSFYF